MEGMDELLSNLDRFKQNSADAMENAATAGAYEAIMHIREYAPVKEGILRKSYDQRTEDKDDDHILKRIGSDCPYAARQELGFVGADSLGRIYHQKGTPHVRPGVYNHKQEIFVAVKSAMKGQLGL